MKKITAIVTICLILCCFVGIASATTEERITNGDFSNGLNGWTYDSSSLSGTASITDVTLSGGETAAYFVLAVPTGYTDVPTAYVSQTVDLTNVNTITWKTKQLGTQTTGSSRNLYIYKDGEVIASYTYSQLGSDWTTRSYTVPSGVSGNCVIKFEGQINHYEGNAGATMAFYLTDISAVATTTEPTVSAVWYDGSSTISNPVFQKESTATVKYSFSQGTYSSSTATIDWGDSSSSESLTVGTDKTITHTYSSVGVYTPQISISNTGTSTVSSTINLATAYVVSIDLEASPTSGDPGTTVAFTITGTLPSDVSITGYSWNFGDSGTSTLQAPTHEYATAGTYDVSLTATLSAGSGYTITVTEEDMILISSQTVSFSKSSAEAGTTFRVSWNLRDSDFPYKLYLYPSTNAGVISDYTAKYTGDINTATGYVDVSVSNYNGYLTAYIQKGSTIITQSATPLYQYQLVSLTVNVLDNSLPYTSEQTTVKLYYSNGTMRTSKTTSAESSSYSNQVIFGNTPTGDYYVTISASNMTDKTSPTISITSDYILDLDFTLGVSDSSSSGVGSQYATTFVTFRTQDSGTGRYISDVQIIATAVQPTNAWEYFANLFGASLGTVIQSMTLSGTSDADGRITFAMYQNVRYNLNITYNKNGKSYHEDRSFQQSSLSGEYLISIPLTEIKTEKITENLVTSVNTTDTAIITNFTDYSGTVTNCTVTVYKKNGDERENLNMSVTYTNPIQGIPKLQTFTPSDPSGQSYIVSFVIHSTEYGTKTQEYGVTFSGVAVKLGDIPSEWYIWISFAILLMTGAVATFVNSRHFAIVVCIVATLLYFAGWLNQLGTIAPIALVICYVLTIVYYIANNHNGGV